MTSFGRRPAFAAGLLRSTRRHDRAALTARQLELLRDVGRDRVDLHAEAGRGRCALRLFARRLLPLFRLEIELVDGDVQRFPLLVAR